MNRQEVFEKVVRHLLAQKVRSVELGGQCRYRGPNGRKCAVGILIPDDKYHPSMEGKSVDGLLKSFPGCIPGDITKEDVEFLQHLQYVHDDVEVALKNYKVWEHTLRVTAGKYNLIFPEDAVVSPKESSMKSSSEQGEHVLNDAVQFAIAQAFAQVMSLAWCQGLDREKKILNNECEHFWSVYIISDFKALMHPAMGGRIPD